MRRKHDHVRGWRGVFLISSLRGRCPISGKPSLLATAGFLAQRVAQREDGWDSFLETRKAILATT